MSESSAETVPLLARPLSEESPGDFELQSAYGSTQPKSVDSKGYRVHSAGGRRSGSLFTLAGMVFFVLLLWYAGFTHEHSANDDMSAYSGGRAALEAADAPPTVLFFLMDDLGWNDIGYQSSDIALASPAMTAAARAGVTLAWYYTYPECTPSRSSLLTGQYASTVGMQHDCITTCDPFGVPSTFSLLPEVLKQQQPLYTTAMVGKWDLGHYAPALWPTERGFDSSLHLSCYGYKNYHHHLNLGGYQDLHDGFDNVELADTLGTHDGDVDDLQREMIDSADSRYSTFVFARRVLSVLEDHANALVAASASSSSSYPGLFLYIAWNAVHTTVSIPNGYNSTDEYAEITANVDMDSNPTRALLAGALKAADDAFALILNKIKSEGLYDNSVIVVASDNGGSVADGGNNYPFRGAKKTHFEGGVHLPAFVHSPLLPITARGATLNSLVHVSDWLPTLAFGLQGSSNSAKALSGSFNGVDQWTAIRMAGSTSSAGVEPRTVLECGMDYLVGSVKSDDDGESTVAAASSITDVAGCVVSRVGNHTFKLIWNEDFSGWTLPNNENTMVDLSDTTTTSRYRAFLFDMSTDPYESDNLLWSLSDNNQRVLHDTKNTHEDLEFPQVSSTNQRAPAPRVQEKRRNLQALSTESSEHDSAEMLENQTLAMLTHICALYNAMAPAQWKEKEGYPKRVFAANDNFVSYWTTEVNDASDYAGSDGVSIDGPTCDPAEMLAYIKSDNDRTSK